MFHTKEKKKKEKEKKSIRDLEKIESCDHYSFNMKADNFGLVQFKLNITMEQAFQQNFHNI